MRNSWIELAAPLVVAAVMFFPDERTRWLTIGLITSVALAAAVWAGLNRSALLIVGIALLRWVPWVDVMILRELIVLLGVAFLFAVLQWRAAASAVEESATVLIAALAVAVVTPSVPARGLAYPFVVAFGAMLPFPLQLAVAALCLFAIHLVRYSFAPLLIVAAIVFALPLVRRIPFVPQTAAVALFVLWPWSGLLARSFAPFLRATHASAREQRIGIALDASRSVSVDVPPGTRSVVVTASAAQGSRLRPGTFLGRIDLIDATGSATSRPIAIGDIADFEFVRREQFLVSRNAPPRAPVDDIRGFGSSTWLYGAGRMRIENDRDVQSVRVTAADSLRSGCKLQVESIAIE